MASTKSSERRERHERRHDDLGPPAGRLERRIRPDRRHPEVEDLHFDDHIEIHDHVVTHDEKAVAYFGY
jgi:hypothetical protein